MMLLFSSSEAGPAPEVDVQAVPPLLQLARDSEGAGCLSVRSQGKFRHLHLLSSPLLSSPLLSSPLTLYFASWQPWWARLSTALLRKAWQTSSSTSEA